MRIGLKSHYPAETHCPSLQTAREPYEKRRRAICHDVMHNGHQNNGLEVQAKLAKISLRTRVIIMTGRKDTAVEATAIPSAARSHP